MPYGGRAAVLLSFLLTILHLLLVQSEVQQDARLEACKRRGWVFLPDVQQESWSAIINCDPSREPWATCDSDPLCVGFTSNGNAGNGWMYRLPRAKQCRPLDNLDNLQWEWSWKWVPMTCKDRGPCCGTYVANDAGPDAAFTLRCQETSSGSSSSSSASRQCACPNLFATHYSSRREFDKDCDAYKAQQAALSSSNRALRASGPTSLQKLYMAEVTKAPVPGARGNAVVSQAGSQACTAVSRTCKNLLK